MRKVIATFLASLLLFPAGSFAQDSKVNRDAKVGQEPVIGSIGTLRESAIRQARLAVAMDASVQASQGPTWSTRHPVGLGALLGAVIGAAALLIVSGTGGCGEEQTEPYCAGLLTASGAGLGAGVGALIGFAVSR